MSNKTIEATIGKAEDFTNEQKKVQRLLALKESIIEISTWPECTKTDKTMLAKAYNNVHLKLNQGKLL